MVITNSNKKVRNIRIKNNVKRQPSSWPSRFRLIILGGNRQGLQVDRDKAVLFGDWGEARSEKA